MKIKQFNGGYNFLSNFYPSPIRIDGVSWSTVEHYYQAMKSKDAKWQDKVRDADAPRDARRMGRRVKIRDDWEYVKDSIMEKAVRTKFTQHAYLKRLLLNTGDLELEEGNNHRDKYWGIDLKTGIGKNMLGKILMKIRDELRA
jgi:ribA/ribD-fused uncharacterized protein